MDVIAAGKAAAPMLEAFAAAAGVPLRTLLGDRAATRPGTIASAGADLV